MAGGKETPRQKMIGMMYLVLTALLALNISKEVLNGFVKVENSLLTTQGTLSGKVNETNTELEVKYAQNQEKVKPFRDQATQVNKSSNDLIAYITELKARAMASSTGDYKEQEATNFDGFLGKDASGRDTVLNLKYIAQKDEYMALTEFMVGGAPNAPKEGEWTALQLRTSMESYRDELKAISFKDNQGVTRTLPPNLLEQLDETFLFGTEMEDGKEVLWEAANFYDVPLAAVMPLMTKMTLDIQDIQEDILSWLLGSVDAKSYKFTNLLPLVVPESNYILRGDSFRANVLLAAFDGTNPPEFYVDAQKFNGRDSSMLDFASIESLPIGTDGLGKLRISTKGMALGDVNYKGLIRFQGPDGNIEPYPFYTPSFTVAEPALVVSPTKMNVFYRGLPNPVEVSVPGVANDALEVRISGDNKIKKQPDGSYVVDPGKGTEAKITVTATMPDGSKKTLPTRDFRVKRIPDPVPSFAGKTPTDRLINKNTLLAAPGLSAQMKNFDFDVNVTVKSFDIATVRDGILITKTSNSNRLSSEMSKLLNRVNPGSVIYIENIVVSMPDGTTRPLAPMKLKVT